MRTILEWKELNVAPKGKKPVLVHHVNKATHTKWEDARKDFNQRLEGVLGVGYLTIDSRWGDAGKLIEHYRTKTGDVVVHNDGNGTTVYAMGEKEATEYVAAVWEWME